MTTPPRTDREIELLLSTPTPAVQTALPRLTGDFAVLGVGGKMGTTTAVMLRRALDAAGRRDTRVYGVSRFSRPEMQSELESFGVQTVACDLTDSAQVAALPEAQNVLFLAGQKFGTDGAPELTWIQNTYVPALVAQRYRRSRIVVFSTGCVYPYAPTDGPGSHESDPVAFLGDYAASCVGRERAFTYFSKQHGTPQLIYRLYYATELRYGVLVDIAQKVLADEPIDVTMGSFNCIWQGDACARAILCLEHTATPPRFLNVTVHEKRSIRAIAAEFGRRFGRTPRLQGREAGAAWIADARECERLFGPAETSLEQMLDLIAAYLTTGGHLLGKPTHFETRDGKF